MVVQNKNLILMVRPAQFYSNPETAFSNGFQHPEDDLSLVAAQALCEFDSLVFELEQNGITVHIEQDILERDTPDSIFPNNWISFHDSVLHLYPIFNLNRRRERSLRFIENLLYKYQLPIKYIRDFSHEENLGRFLESTGSIVFDHTNLKAYACLSVRTNESVFKNVCEALGYQAITFSARDNAGLETYHTNVLMSIGEKFAVICANCVNVEDRDKVIKSLENDGKEVIQISYEAMLSFCGNILQLQSLHGNKVIAMSTNAYKAFSLEQRQALANHGKLVYSDISTIEQNGGGGVRCMICEIK